MGGVISALEVWATSKIRSCRMSSKQPRYKSSLFERVSASAAVAVCVSVSEFVCLTEAVMLLVVKLAGMTVYTEIDQ